jgi:predicted homoserine dehydrogenase-like protein
MNRRSFIKSGALAATSFAIPLTLKAGTDNIKLAILGTGNWGTEVILKSALSSRQFEIVALCDVNVLALDKAADVVVKFGMPKPKLFNSYQEMYEMKGLQAGHCHANTLACPTIY